VKRLWFIGAVVLVLLVGFGVWLKSPREDPWVPGFLTQAVSVAAKETNRAESHPFRKMISPNHYEVLSSEGVRWHDYLVEGNFASVENTVQSELQRKDGWEALYTTPDSDKASHKVTEMDALFVRGGHAVTVYRVPLQHKVKVRVWTRTPPPFSGML
jgi:hypothetical protein